jgi:hypothetical protein
MARATGTVALDDYEAVFSRVLGAVFIVGGREQGSNNRTGEIWMIKEGSTPTLLNVPGYLPRLVRAATVDLADQMLWILDRGNDPAWPGINSVSKLVRINLRTLEHEVIWVGPSNWYFDNYWLTVDRDGQVLLTSSSLSWDLYATMRIEADPYVLGTEVPTAEQYGYGRLVTAPMVDAEGYLFVAVDGQNGFQTLRVEELAPPSPNGISIGNNL